MLTETEEPQLDLENVFGVNVKKMFLDWFETEYRPAFRRQYGDEANITAILLDPRLSMLELIQAWSHPASLSHITVHTATTLEGEAAAMTRGGTYQNVCAKLHFCLAHLIDSKEAEKLTYLIREGDFAWEGAGEINGAIGGVSGFPEGKTDWEELTKLSPKLCELLGAVNTAAKAKVETLEFTPEYPKGLKYLRGGINVSDQFPGYEAGDGDNGGSE